MMKMHATIVSGVYVKYVVVPLQCCFVMLASLLPPRISTSRILCLDLSHCRSKLVVRVVRHLVLVAFAQLEHSKRTLLPHPDRAQEATYSTMMVWKCCVLPARHLLLTRLRLCFQVNLLSGLQMHVVGRLEDGPLFVLYLNVLAPWPIYISKVSNYVCCEIEALVFYILGKSTQMKSHVGTCIRLRFDYEQGRHVLLAIDIHRTFANPQPHRSQVHLRVRYRRHLVLLQLQENIVGGVLHILSLWSQMSRSILSCVVERCWVLR